MKLLWTASVLLPGIFVSSASSSPVDQNSPFRFNDQQLDRRNSPNTCSASSIQSAESRANKSLRQTISTLCSSLQSKYKTVTHSVYTATTTPKTTTDITHTAARPVGTATITAEVTQQTTDLETSTSVTVFTTVATETDTVETDTVTVTAPVVVPRKQYPCQQIESLLSLSAGSATPFCSCYESGPTSTTTVTAKGASTASETHVTDQTTVTPSTSQAVQTVYQTTLQTVTVEEGTVITSTTTASATISVTDIVTTTASPTPPIGCDLATGPSYSLDMIYGSDASGTNEGLLFAADDGTYVAPAGYEFLPPPTIFSLSQDGYLVDVSNCHPVYAINQVATLYRWSTTPGPSSNVATGDLECSVGANSLLVCAYYSDANVDQLTSQCFGSNSGEYQVSIGDVGILSTFKCYDIALKATQVS